MSESVRPKVVLVVDDEVYVLHTVCSILTHWGYTVLPASSAEEAMEIAQGYSGNIDLLLSDVIMPRMSGPKMAERMGPLHPEMAYLFIAGLPDNPEIEERVLGRGLAFLPKPFFSHTLIDKVQEVLDVRAISAASPNRRAASAV